MTGYLSTHEHLTDELRRLDLRIALRAATLAAQLHPPGQLERAVYVSDEEVHRLLAGPDTPAPAPAPARAALAAVGDEIAVRLAAGGVEPALPRLGRLLGLSDFELQAVLICLAPELRRRYDRLYAYLQDDITRRRPSVDLVLELLCDDERERWRRRRLLAEGAPLLRTGVLEPVPDPASPSGSSGLARFLRLDPRIVGFLLDEDEPDRRLAGHAVLDPAPAGREPDGPLGLLAGLHRLVAGRPRCVLVLHGPDPAGQRELVGHLCGRLGRPLLHVEAATLVADHDAARLPAVLLRESVLRAGAVHLAGADALLTEPARPVLAALADAVTEYGGWVFCSGRRPWPPGVRWGAAEPVSVRAAGPTRAVRAAVWQRELAARGLDPAAAGTLARYRLTPSRIRAAVAAAVTDHELRGDPTPPTPTELGRACRDQSDGLIAELATRVPPRYGWADLVLPESRMALLREICSQVAHQQRVFEDWGFGARLRHGRGLTALFSGPPGTGKTLAAQVVAGEVGLDLYRIDLSAVVSKYIGETEKNLSRIFDEAANSNAILFFDEADALFGKRSEVHDAHDRYANIETSYLLARLEEHAGVVLLASNLPQNLDAAFARRIRFLVDFPFPDQEQRRQIWRTHFPPAAPVAADVDCAFLAREFPVAGGSIKNIVLNAAFLAAADGGVITSEHLLAGTRREFDKAGKVWSEPRRP